MRDTDERAAAVQRDVYRRWSPERRLRTGFEMSETARELARAGIRARHPDYDAAQVEAALRRLIYGDELFRRAWPRAPRLAP